MINKVKELISLDEMYEKLIKQVYETPYITNKAIFEHISEEKQTNYEEKLNILVKEFILVELTSQSGSSVESRVPQKIFIINPEIEEDIEKIFS